jgi:hypothetical protein
MSVESGYVASANGASADVQEGGRGRSVVPEAGLELIRRRPELLVGAAFAGGMLAALLLRRFGR